MSLKIFEPRLDRSRDYGQVCGAEVTMFEQDGILFYGDGRPVDAMPQSRPEPAQPSPPKPDEGELDDMDTAELRSLVESYGGVWRGRDAAKKFVRGQP